MPPDFFFQAEDGIRDLYVTGVQTCALPIWKQQQANAMDFDDLLLFPLTLFVEHPERLAYWQRRFDRSEERRVGKECSARWAACHENNGNYTLPSRVEHATMTKQQVVKTGGR